MTIRVMEKADVEFAAALTADEGWYYTPRELDLMRRLDPEGSFIFEDDERLGFATCVTYGRTGVLGHLVVSKKGRGRKIGESLLNAAMNYMTSRGARSILLYATKEGVRLYQKHGFAVRDEIFCAHLNLQSQHRRDQSRQCVPLSKSDLAEVTEIDRTLFGDNRRLLLDALFDEGPMHAFKMVRDGRIMGYVMARHDHVGYDLGPWTCMTGDPKDAQALFWTALSTLEEGTIYMGSFMKNQEALKIVNEVPIVRSWKIPLMIRGEGRYNADIGNLFGIAAFELG